MAGKRGAGLGAMSLEHLRRALGLAEQEGDDTRRQAGADFDHDLDERFVSYVA